jgi:transposase
MVKFREWLEANSGVYPPKSPMGNAVAHALKNWEALTQFLKSEQTPLDNNKSESALRIVALSRKNSLTIGHDDAGENLAHVLTLCATCQAASVNPQEYLADVLLRVQLWPADRLEDLLPANWQALKNAGQLPPINA